ncbi:hypothetical protein [Winogradskyella endarachnes]|uniref:Type II secretion system protein GspG C-terminal domain-containing protein n=1 Tax=Winogradskyella endarachnes TaxID=2681965 RepID=A0A6L6UBJ4_9FLAO|nr:hypothetical protein [Winogradskyella endarachnes]MUU78124.1 hypothetical protein [Winogradskyella endarachnes]
MFDVLAELLYCREDYKYRKRLKARRKFEDENNLPRKIIIHPVWRLIFIVVLVIVMVRLIVGFIFVSDNGLKQTSKQILVINEILEKEKQAIGSYPQELKTIIRNNPLRKHITKDYWGNEFFYQQLDNGQSYILISNGKDGILKTEDDIK